MAWPTFPAHPLLLPAPSPHTPAPPCVSPIPKHTTPSLTLGLCAKRHKLARGQLDQVVAKTSTQDGGWMLPLLFQAL